MREAWSKIHRCYRKENVHPTTPTREGLEQTSTLREDIYRRRPQEGEAIPVLVQQVSITDGTMEGEEVAVAVKILQMGCTRGLSNMNQ